jgi:predicted site-specific integrase-resolvase
MLSVKTFIYARVSSVAQKSDCMLLLKKKTELVLPKV